MATVKQYVMSLWEAQRVISRKLGFDIRRAPLETRCIVLAVDVTLGVVIKVLTDGGVITDAALQTRMNAVRDAVYPQQPASVPAPDETTGDVPDPDMGA